MPNLWNTSYLYIEDYLNVVTGGDRVYFGQLSNINLVWLVMVPNNRLVQKDKHCVAARRVREEILK